MDWKSQLFKTVMKHIRASKLRDGSVMSWWLAEHNQILGEIEQVIEEETTPEVLNELNSLAIIIGADANIDNNDPNVQRIIYIINKFIDEIEQEVDFSDDEDTE
jgi:hypothetical protein